MLPAPPKVLARQKGAEPENPIDLSTLTCISFFISSFFFFLGGGEERKTTPNSFVPSFHMFFLESGLAHVVSRESARSHAFPVAAGHAFVF